MGKATYYNFISVRDQVLSAQQNNKCDYKLDLPKDVIKLSINSKTWITLCSDPCRTGYCPVFLQVLIPNQAPKQGTIYYVKGAPIAYVTFLPSILDFLRTKNILGALEIVINAPSVLPDTAPYNVP